MTPASLPAGPADASHHIGILLFDGVEELDFAGPWEVLAAWCGRHPQDGWRVHLLTRDGGPVRCGKGMTAVPSGSTADAPPLDVLVHPGGRTEGPQEDAEHLAWLRDQRSRVPLLVSVCSGSVVLGAAGLLAGRPATSHWSDLEPLAATDASIRVLGEERFVDDGDVITSSGVSAGIDVSLHLVARLAGVERAREVRRRIQYDPAPPV